MLEEKLSSLIRNLTALMYRSKLMVRETVTNPNSEMDMIEQKRPTADTHPSESNPRTGNYCKTKVLVKRT